MQNLIKKLRENRTLCFVLLAVAALLLLTVLWAVFSKGESAAQTEKERRVQELISTLDSVDRATVYIAEESGTPKSAVVIFKGEDGILVRMQILEITSSALGIEKNAVQVYPAN